MKLRLVLSLAILLCCSISTQATVRYIAQSAGTFSGGSACNGQTAITVATFDGLSLSPADTTYLCGTVSAPAGSSNYITIGQSGSAGNPITLIFDTGAVLTATYWSGAAIEFSGQNYIVINGGTNGILQATANGIALANQVDAGIGVLCSTSCSNDIVENLTIQNIFVRTCVGAESTCTSSAGGNTFGIYMWGGANDRITGNTVHDVHWTIVMLYGSGASNSTFLRVDHNTVYNTDHGVIFGDQCSNSTATGSNCSNSVDNNDISGFVAWDQSGDAFHHDGVHAWANNAPGSNYYVCIHDNYIHGAGGYFLNSFIFMESASQSSFIFNNILNLTANGNPGNCTGTGILGPATGSPPGATGISLGVYNNTVQGYSTSFCEDIGVQEQTSPTLKNNIAMTAAQYVYTASITSGMTFDYNLYFNTPNGFTGPCGGQVSFATWKASCGEDAHSQIANPNLSASFVPNSGSPAIGAGTNLTSLGITALDVGAPQTFGAGGSCGSGCLARSASGAWDVGAYPFISSLPAPATKMLVHITKMFNFDFIEGF